MFGLGRTRKWASVVVVCLLAASFGGAVAAQDTAEGEVSRSDVELRDQLIASQESLLNVYRCMFSIDTQIVPGGCFDGQPSMGPVEAKLFQGTPTQGELITRDALITAQESLLNVYRCMFSIDTQIVPGGCVDGRPGSVPEATVTVNPTPGQGVRVNMARASWTSGFVQAEIYRNLLHQLGYDVNELANAMYHPRDFYQGMANGQFHFWANGRFPSHSPYFEQTGLSGLARPIGYQMRSGGLEGILVDKATADAHGITRWDDIGDNPEIADLFDRDDDGKAEIMGCDLGWACHTVIDETISTNGWQATIEQVSASHSDLFAGSLSRMRNGEPFLQYVWSPSPYTALLVPGENVIWLSLDNPLAHHQNTALLPVEQCPGQPCKTGFTTVDIRVVARNDFLETNPAAKRLFELVDFSPVDISRLTHMHLGSDISFTEADVKSAAAQWITENRMDVDQWLAAARAAA